MTYSPEPLDTSRVVLPAEIAGLVELLARNIHEVWAQHRIAEGWTYGPARDERVKSHPCLVPYDELPESEKEYDRRAVVGVLASIYSLGYGILRMR